MRKPDETLNLYITQLDDEYKSLLNILCLEAADISAADEKRLEQHIRLEREAVRMITSLTNVVHTYLENIEPDDDMTKTLNKISESKKQAQAQISENIRNLEHAMSGIKKKIELVKLPKSARRVYYSGNNATIMDIEI